MESPITDQSCWDYINQNMWTVIPMDQDTFRNRSWTSIRELGPDISGNVYQAGILGNEGCRGYWDPQRQAGALSPGA
jgi:hypothetical protein